MRVLIALVVLAASLSLGGCSHPNQAAHAKPLPSHPTKANRVKPRPLTVRKLEATQVKRPRARKLPVLTEATSLRPQSVKKLPEQAKISSVVKPPPLPVRKPEQAQSPTPSRGDAGTSSSERHGAVGQEAEAKFKAAQAKAKLEGVHSLTQEDIDGLSPEQIKELRGY